MLAALGAEPKGSHARLGVPKFHLLCTTCLLFTLAFIAVCFRNKLQGESLGPVTLDMRMG